MLLWTNKSTFYEYLHPLLVAHVKKHVCTTVSIQQKFWQGWT